jgi:hypothetical protein
MSMGEKVSWPLVMVDTFFFIIHSIWFLQKISDSCMHYEFQQGEKILCELSVDMCE